MSGMSCCHANPMTSFIAVAPLKEMVPYNEDAWWKKVDKLAGASFVDIYSLVHSKNGADLVAQIFTIWRYLFLGITSNLKFFLLGFTFLKLHMQVAIFFRRTQRTTMASHGTSPSSQSPAMLPAGRHEPFVQRKARRRPYRRCPPCRGSFDVRWCLATPEFSIFFLMGGAQQLPGFF